MTYEYHHYILCLRRSEQCAYFPADSRWAGLTKCGRIDISPPPADISRAIRGAVSRPSTTSPLAARSKAGAPERNRRMPTCCDGPMSMIEEGGSTHETPTGRGTKKAPLSGRPLRSMEAKPGFEPGVKALQASALPLGQAAVIRKEPISQPAPKVRWSGQRGSNPRPQPWQGCALPTEPCPLVVGDTRFELVTPSVSGKCSPPELIARLRCALQRGTYYNRAQNLLQQLF